MFAKFVGQIVDILVANAILFPYIKYQTCVLNSWKYVKWELWCEARDRKSNYHCEHNVFRELNKKQILIMELVSYHHGDLFRFHYTTTLSTSQFNINTCFFQFNFTYLNLPINYWQIVRQQLDTLYTHNLSIWVCNSANIN